MNAVDILFSLLRHEINGGEECEAIKKCIDDKMLLNLYELSNAHDLSHLVANALSKIGVLTDDDISKNYKKQKILSIYRRESINFHLNSIKKTLTKGQIPFIPLKGAVIKDYYPEEWMRTCCDIDILVHEEDLGKAIDALKEAQWQVQGKKGYHDISLYGKGGALLELHFNIKENMENLDAVLERVWENSTQKGSTEFEYKENNEFLMFHLLSHIAYHFKKGGCGIRTILDVWLLKKKLKIDEKELKNLCEEAKIDVFADEIMKLSGVWFDGKTHTETTKKMEDFILFGGVYGNQGNRVSVEHAVAGGKGKSLLKRMVMPYDKMVIRYPVLKNYKFLTPVFQIARWFSVIKNRKLNDAINEYNVASESSQENIKNMRGFLKEVGLI